MNLQIKIALLILTSLCSLTVKSQSEGDYCIVRTYDGNVFQGKILSNREDSLVINEYNIGKLSLDQNFIKSVKVVTSKKYSANELNLHSSVSSKYVLSPSAFPLKKGEAYYNNTMLLFNHFSYGITDQLGVGFSAVPLFLVDEDPSLYAFSVKYSTTIAKDLRWSIGAIGGNFFQEAFYGNEDESALLANTNLTYGNPRNNISVGYSSNLNASGRVYTVSFSLKLTNKFSLGSENYLIRDEDYDRSTHLLGLRYISKYIFFDAGIIVYSDMYDTEAIPGFSMTVPIRFSNSENYKVKRNKKI